MAGEFIPATTGLSRLFVIDGRAGPARTPEYFACFRAQAVSQSFGEITDIECPDPVRPGKFVKIGQFQGAEDRATVTLEGRLALDLRSTFLRMAKKSCPIDVQVHFGDCENLSDHNTFKKILYLHNARLSAYNTEDLGSLSSGDTASVNESVDVSAEEIFDIVPNNWASRGGDLVTTEVVDVTICDDVSCGDCGDASGGCNKIFAITLQAGGSPGTPPDVVYSLDGGITWFAHDIDSMSAAEDPDEVACLKGFLVVVSQDSGSAHYAALDEFDEFGTDPDFTEVSTGFEAGGEPRAIDALNTVAYIAGAGGRIYKMTNPADGVEVLEDGSLTASPLNAIDALNERMIVAVGNAGVILYSNDGATFNLLTTSPVGVGVNLNAVAVKSKEEWWVGSSAGRLYYTLDAGQHWTEKVFPGSGSGIVYAIEIQNDSIIHLAHTTAAALGRVLTSFNGGYDWEVMPFGSALMPDNDRLVALAACRVDPELVVAVGLRSGSDGIIVTGRM